MFEYKKLIGMSQDELLEEYALARSFGTLLTNTAGLLAVVSTAIGALLVFWADQQGEDAFFHLMENVEKAIDVRGATFTRLLERHYTYETKINDLIEGEVRNNLVAEIMAAGKEPASASFEELIQFLKGVSGS
jgi:hypothetical protein